MALNVMVFPAGTELGLELHDALSCSLNVNIFGATSRKDNSLLTYERCFTVPYVSSDEFLESFSSLISNLNIRILFATHDDVQVLFSEYAKDWGVYLVNGNLNASRLSRSKRNTYDFFSRYDWVPRVYNSISEVESWPVVVKPDIGQGAQDVFVVSSEIEASGVIKKILDPVFCEYLPGAEITVDCFTDFNRNLLSIMPRERERILAGISVRSVVLERSQTITRIANQINNEIMLRGPWFFQLKKDSSGQWKLLEFSCRMSSGSVFSRAAGVNLALMAVHDYLQRPLKVLAEQRVKAIDRRITSKMLLDYDYENVFIDLDDTLVISGKAYPVAMQFIYRMLNLEKKIFLITRHTGCVEIFLDQHKIHKGIFHHIFHLKKDELKSSVILDNSIFIDNHFPERLDVASICGIPVFDVDALELIV